MSPENETPLMIGSLVVDNPQIDEVMNLETGETLPVFDLVGDDYERAIQLRMAMKEGNATGRSIWACPVCAVPVHMVSMSQERRFYLRHETEDGRCPIRTKGHLSPERIQAMKYDGARESAAHRNMKEIIANSLACDPNFSCIEIEPVWKGAEKNSRRRPDVRAVWKGTLPVAFEVQLSTAFLQVLAERRMFYLREGGLLFWVFRKFDMGDARLTQEDIFYNNNRNAFVADKATLDASRTARALVLDCVWSEPTIETGSILWGQKRQLVRFCDLTLEQSRQRAFFFDTDSARQYVEDQVRNEPLRQDFAQFWMSTEPYDHQRWLSLRRRLSERGLVVPEFRGDMPGFRELLNTMYSAREGRPVGWGYDNLVKLGHHVFDKQKGHLWAFKLMLSAHDRGRQILEEDETENWRNKKVQAYRAAWADPNLPGASQFAPDRRFDDLLAFLFPEISTQLAQTPN